MIIKALFSDVDRTILTSDYHLPEKVTLSFKEFSKHAHTILATARSPQGVLPICERLGIDIAICFNGGWAGNPIEMTSLWETRLERDLAISIMQAATELKITALWYLPDAVWTLCLSDDARREADITGERIFEAKSLEELPGDPFKIMCSRSNTDDHAFEEVRQRFSSDCEISASNSRLLELTPLGVSKGVAAARLARHLGLDAHLCAAAGDAENDLAMLAWAGLPVTVANATPECLSLAKYVGPSANEGGMADILDWVTALAT